MTYGYCQPESGTQHLRVFARQPFRLGHRLPSRHQHDGFGGGCNSVVSSATTRRSGRVWRPIVPIRKNPMPKVLISPREVAKFRDKFRDVLEGAGLEVVVLPPAEANQPTEDE